MALASWLKNSPRPPAATAARKSPRLKVETLEDRVTPDATFYSGTFMAVAKGPTATFDTQGTFDTPRAVVAEGILPANNSSFFSITSSKSPVDVYRSSGGNPQLLFTMPEGGQFRETTVGGKAYADIVPRWGLISVPNGLAANAQAAQQQTLTFNSNGSAVFTLRVGQSTTRLMYAGMPAETVQQYLNELPSVGGAGLRATVANATVTGSGQPAYSVTFSGPSAAQTPLMAVQVTGAGVTGTVRPVTTVALTKRDTSPLAAANDGIGSFYLPLSGHNAVDTPYYTGTGTPSFYAYNTGASPDRRGLASGAAPTNLWAIPANLASTVAAGEAADFTPTALGIYPTYEFGSSQTGWHARLIGHAQFSSLVGGIELANPADPAVQTRQNGQDAERNFSRVQAGPQGFSLMISPATEYKLAPVQRDAAGNARPVTFPFAGLNFTVPAADLPKLTFDAGANAFRSAAAVTATAAYQGGSLTVRFGSLSVGVATGKLTLPAPTLVSLALGGFVIPASAAFQMAYDAGAEKFSFAMTGLRLDSSASSRSNFQKQVIVPITNGQNFKLKAGGYTTGELAYNASAEEIRAALAAGGVVAPVTRAGGYLGGAITITLPADGPAVKVLAKLNAWSDFYEYQPETTYSGTTDPVRLTVPSGGLTITRGVLAPVRDLPVTAVEIGRSAAATDAAGNLVPQTTFLPFTATETGLLARFVPKNEYAPDGTVRLAGNSFAVYGKAKTPLAVAGVSVPGTADLGTADAPGMVVTNAVVDRVVFPVSDLAVGALRFTGAAAGSVPPMTAGYYPPKAGEPQSYVISGGATLQPGGTVFNSGLQANLGGGGSDGLRLYPAESRFTFGFGVVGSFKAGSNTIKGGAGADALKVLYDPAARTYNLAGEGVLDLDPQAAKPPVTLAAGQQLNKGESRVSSDGRYQFVLQQDGNLVWYEQATGRAVWAAGSNGAVTHAVMQADGDFVVYNGAAAVWATRTGNNPGAQLALQNDGNLRVLAADGRVLWQSNTAQAAGGTAAAGRTLRVTATVPAGVANFPANRLDGAELNFFVADRASVNGFTFSPLATANPLRVTLTKTADQIKGDFSLALEGRELRGTVTPTALTNGVFPAAGLPLDFTQVGAPWPLGGVLFSGLRTATLTTELRLPFAAATFENQPLAAGQPGAEPNLIVASNGRVTAGTITNPAAQQVGDVKFTSFTAKYTTQTTPPAWVFSGAGTRFDKPVTAGSAGAVGGDNIAVRIGGAGGAGQQLTIDTPAPAAQPGSFPAPAEFAVAGVDFDLSKLTKTVTEDLAASKTYQFSTPDYTVRVGRTELALNVTFKLKVSAAGAELVSFAATGKQNSTFSVGSASFQIKSATVEYDFAQKALKLSGAAKFTFAAAKATVDMDVTLGDQATPGLVLKDGAVQSLKVGVSGTFDLMKLKITVPATEALTVEYDRASQTYAFYGQVRLSTAAQAGAKPVIDDLSVSLGAGPEKPGLRVVSGAVESVDITVNGNINLFGLTAAPKDLRVQYTKAENQLQITGGVDVTLTKGMVLSASLPGDGLLIDTATGAVQIKGVRLAADGDIKFGALTVKKLFVEYGEANGQISLAAGADLVMPGGLEVGGSFKIIDGRLDAISVTFAKNPGILVANGLVNIYSISGSIEGLTDLDNFKLSATVKATVGPAVMFAGQTYALADVQGTITVTPRDLTLEGKVDLVGGLFGKGDFKGVLNWTANGYVSFDANVQLYPGGIVRGNISARIDFKGNVDFNASVGVFVPNGVPVVGNTSLGKLQIGLRVRPDEPPANSYVTFRAQVLNVNGGVTAKFDGMVDYDLMVDFYFFSLSKRGSFSLRDADDRPAVSVLSAAAVPGTPAGRVVFAGTAPRPDGATVDLYATTEPGVGDGALIGSSIPLAAGEQTFIWEDMAAFAPPGKPVYVYAVINEPDSEPAYSDLSNAFSTDSGFVPGVTVPATPARFRADRTTVFSSATGTAVVVTDPRLATEPTSRTQVTLDVGGGALALPRAAAGVTVRGDGTGRVVLVGTATEITALLDGLSYTPDAGATRDDALAVTAAFVPMDSMTGGVTATLALTLDPLTMSQTPVSADGRPATTVPRQEIGRPLQGLALADSASDFITGARVTIDNYAPGRDVLGFAAAAEAATGLRGSFDPDTGVLSLTGFARIDVYQDALERVTVYTADAAGVKGLFVEVADDRAHRAAFRVPVTVTAAEPPPAVAVGPLGAHFAEGDDTALVAPAAVLTAPAGATVTGVKIEFLAGTFRVGHDRLAFDATGPITGEFDPDTGVLTLAGVGSAADFQEALRAVYYEVDGGPFQPGMRYLLITVAAEAPYQATGTTLSALAVSTGAVGFPAPVVEFSAAAVTLPADRDDGLLDPGLELYSDLLPDLTGVTVQVTGGYVIGEDVLGLTELPEGIGASFDMATGTLTLTGVAAVADYEVILRRLVYRNEARNRHAGPREITVTAANGMSEPEAETLTVTVLAAPHLEAGLGDTAMYTRGRTEVVVNSGVVVDYAGTLTGATVAVTGGYNRGEDQLVFTNQNGITGEFRSDTGVLTLSGPASAAAYAAALNSVEYYNARHNPVAGDRIVSFRVWDGALGSAAAEANIVVAPAVVGPTMTLAGAAPAFVGHGAPVPVAATLTLTPADETAPEGSAAQVLYGAEIVVGNFVPSEDILQFTDQNNITGFFDAVNGRLVLTGTDTLANYEAALRSVTYLNRSEAPTPTPRQLSVRLLAGGAGGLSDSVTATEGVQAVSQPPVRTGGATPGLTVVENAKTTSLGLSAAAFAPAATVADASAVALTWAATRLPAETLGRILLADGTPVAPGTDYPIAELDGVQFDPALTGAGADEFRYAVAMTDPATGVRNPGTREEAVPLTVSTVWTATPAEAYVAQIFRDLTGANPDAATLSKWAARIDQAVAAAAPVEGVDVQGAARAKVVRDLAASDEVRGHQVNDVYRQFLGRAATPAETAAGLAALARGGSLQQLRAGLAGSAEYFQRHGDAGYDSFVGMLYIDLVGRPAAQADHARWVGDLQSGRGTTAAVAAAVAGLPEAGRYANGQLLESLLRRPLSAEDERYYAAFLAGPDAGMLVADALSGREYVTAYQTSSAELAAGVRNQPTAGYAAVGKVGDKGGDKAGGTLIAPRHVLVAAHSVAGVPPGQVTFTVGGATYHVTRVLINPDYRPDLAGLPGANDIAVLELDQPVAGVAPAALANGAPPAGGALRLVGFGERNGSPYGTKRVGTTPPVDQVTGGEFSWTFNNPVLTTSAPGDSGSPLFLTSGGVDYVAGIVSGGTTVAAALGDVATNTAVGPYLAWIQSIVGAVATGPAPTAVTLADAIFLANRPAGATVGTLVGVNGAAAPTFAYSLVAGPGDADNAKFTIVGDQLRTAAVLDIAQATRLTVRVRAADASGAGVEQALTIDTARDSFDRADAPALGAGWRTTAGAVAVQAGEARGAGRVFGVAEVAGVSLGDVALEARANFTKNGQTAGLVARSAGAGDANMYLGQVTRVRPNVYAVAIVKAVGPRRVVLARATVTGAATVMRFELVGASLKLFLGDKLAAYARDTAFAAGAVGLRLSPAAGLDDFTVTALAAPAAPALPVTDVFGDRPRQQLGAAWEEPAGNFTVTGGAAAGSAKAVSLATLRGVALADADVRATVALPAVGQSAALVARYRGPADKNYYSGGITRINKTQSRVAITRNINGWTVTLASVIVTGAGGALRFKVAGDSLQLYLGQALVAFAKDRTLTAGGVGLRLAKGATAADFTAAAAPAPLAFADAFNATADDRLPAPTWKAAAGQFGVATAAAVGQSAVNVAALAGVSLADADVRADVVFTAAGQHAALVARYGGAGDTNMYRADLEALDAAGTTVRARIYRNVRGVWTQLGEARDVAFAGLLRFKVTGPTLDLLADGTAVLTRTDTLLKTGSVGIRGTKGATLDNFAVS